MNAEEKRAWALLVASRSDPRIVQVSNSDLAILSAAAVIERAGDIEGMARAIQTADFTQRDTLYMTIARAVSRFILGD